MPPTAIAPSPSLLDQLTGELQQRTGAEVRFDEGSRAIYASDLSHYRQVPIGVVVPRTVDDVVATVSICREHDIPILGRGAGTSLAGQTCNVAVVIDFSKYLHNILELNCKEKYAWVEPGLINDHLRNAAEEHGLTFAPDPATHAYCTLGGMIGNNSCGAHSVMGGKTSENIEELEILTYDGLRMTVGATSEEELQQIISAGGRRGEIYGRLRNLRDAYADEVRERFPQIPRRVSGYNLDYLLPENGFHVARALVGTESTCVLVLKAKTKLMHSPPHRCILLLAYPSVFDAADQSPRLNELGPIAIEGFERKVIDNERLKGKHFRGLDLYPEGEAWLLVEFGGESPEEAIEKGRNARAWAQEHDRAQVGMRLLESREDQDLAMKVREAGLGASRVPGKLPNTYTGWEDAAVPPEKLGAYLRDFWKLLEKYGYTAVLYGHFGQACMHTRMDFDLSTDAGVRRYREFVTEAAHLVVSYGGSLSGEHGDGQARAELLPIMFGDRLVKAFREFKAVWDPANKMNPGKVVDPYPLDSNLRTGPDYKPNPVLTIFQFPDDHGNLSEATGRCFGVGKCRGLDAGTMCPSFQVTREEKHSTRGRARMLWEMLRGDVLHDGWRDEHIHDALDLCLACKGCKGDCPVSVDLATYKAEFLHHYYKGRLRPAAAYSMGLIDKWAALGSRVPGLANLVTQTPGLSALAKKVAGVTEHRDMPAFPAKSFKQWFAGRKDGALGARGEVILWADTFNNYFFPHTAKAAVKVLEDAGFRVRVPQQHLCCGRPLYDFGMLDQAKQYLRDVMDTLADDIEAGTPIVCLEPSCGAVFRDELTNLFPKNPRAVKLQKQVVLFAEFLENVGYRPPQVGGKAVVHGHCHQKAIFGMTSEKRMFEAMGMEPELPDAGCCGLAGSFGYEAEHYDISMQVGERKLLPLVRAQERGTVINADGFSCRQQIGHGTGRTGMHIAEIMAMGLATKPNGKGPYVESAHTEPAPAYPVLTALAAAGLIGAGALYLATRNGKHKES